IRDQHALEDQARTDAVHQAVSHAQAMAASAGEHLGPVCSLTDSNPTPTPVPLYSAGAVAPSAANSPVPLAAGSQHVTSQVTLVYGLDTGSGGS
ncbi:MAG: SIMPL domain-containing protein, partial [Acidimicrobiales bacterium]|nr:SIMPL domain-containing protein [Acidimicrobiales bacterium]